MEPPTPQAIAEALSRSNLSLPPLGSRPDSRGGPSTRRWIYAISGLGAAALSAVITLYLMGYLGRRPVAPPTEPGLPTVASEPDGAASPQDAGAPPSHIADLARSPSADLAASAAASPADQGGALTGSGRVQLSSEPEGAEVFFEKKLLGTTPILLEGLPTDRDIKLELKLQGFKTTRKRIHWRGKDFLEAAVKMRTKDGPGGEGDTPEAPESSEAGNN
jgi:hypothetical protein